MRIGVPWRGCWEIFLGVQCQPPDSFIGIPTLDNRKSWFHDPWEPGNDDINKLWQAFDDALKFADADKPDNRLSFIGSYSDALSISGVGNLLSIGLYWIRPYNFLALDKMARAYLIDVAQTESARLKYPDGKDYLALRDDLKEWFGRNDAPVNSFPELSHEAFVRVLSPRWGRQWYGGRRKRRRPMSTTARQSLVAGRHRQASKGIDVGASRRTKYYRWTRR